MGKLKAIRPVVVLVTVCAVAGLLLGWVHQMTAPVIARAEEERAQEAYAELIPEASSFEEVPCGVDGCVAALRAVDESGTAVGFVVVSEAKGYGGEVPIAVGFDPEGTVTSIMAMPNDETPGLGTRIAEDGYLNQYVGKPAQTLEADSVDLISGATISSKAALAAFNVAVESFEEVR